MSTAISTMRHVRGFDVVRPLSVVALLAVMLPLVLLPLLSIFIFGTSKGLGTFWAALTAPEATFAMQLSLFTSFWATVFNVIFGLFAAYVLSRYDFYGRNAVIVTISLPTAIPTAVAGFALLLLWGPNATLGRLLNMQGFQLMFTPYAIILANIFVTFPLAFGVIKPVFDTMSRSLEEASATIGATRWQTFWYVTLPLQLPIATVALLFGIVFTATDMTVVYILTGGGPFNSSQMLTTWAYQTGINSGNLGEGAAISLYLLPLLLVVAVLMLRFARRVEVS